MPMQKIRNVWLLFSFKTLFSIHWWCELRVSARSVWKHLLTSSILSTVFKNFRHLNASSKKVHVQENRQGKMSSRQKNRKSFENIRFFVRKLREARQLSLLCFCHHHHNLAVLCWWGVATRRRRQPKEMLNFIVGEKTTKGHYKRRFVNLSS